MTAATLTASFVPANAAEYTVEIGPLAPYEEYAE